MVYHRCMTAAVETQAKKQDRRGENNRGKRWGKPIQKGQVLNDKGCKGHRRADFDVVLHRYLTRKGMAEQVVQALLDVASDKDHPQFMNAQRMVWDRVQGPLESSGAGARHGPAFVINISGADPIQSLARAVIDAKATPVLSDSATTGVVVTPSDARAEDRK